MSNTADDYMPHWSMDDWNNYVNGVPPAALPPMPSLPAAAGKAGGVKEEPAKPMAETLKVAATPGGTLIENMRWPSRSDAVTALNVWAANNGKRIVQVKNQSGQQRVVMACDQAMVESGGHVGDKVSTAWDGRPYTATITEVHSNGVIDVMFDDDGVIKSGLSRGEYKLKRTRKVHDKSAPCKMYVVIACIKNKDSANPWSICMQSSKLHHTNCGGAARWGQRTVLGNAAFVSTLAANKGATRKVLDKVLMSEGIELGKSTLYRARRAANGEDVVAYKDSFGKLQSWCDSFNATKGNGHAEVRFNESGNFIGMTVTFRSGLDLAVASGISVSETDMAHSKAEFYRGVHWFLTGHDAENHVVNIAWGVGEAEDKETYLAHFRASFNMAPHPGIYAGPCRDDAHGGGSSYPEVQPQEPPTVLGFLNSKGHCQISDRHKGIPWAQQELFGNARTMFCTKHIINNIRASKDVTGTFMDNQVWAIQKAASPMVCEGAFVKLEVSCPSAAAYLRKIPVDKWALSLGLSPLIALSRKRKA
jgi:hypothetical protein